MHVSYFKGERSSVPLYQKWPDARYFNAIANRNTKSTSAYDLILLSVFIEVRIAGRVLS